MFTAAAATNRFSSLLKSIINRQTDRHLLTKKLGAGKQNS